MKLKSLKVAFYILLLTGAMAAARADNIDDYAKEQMAALKIPGMAIGVARDGKLILSRSYGLSNIELKATVTENSVFEIGSMTKPFTAAAIMMLVEEGKIGLEEKISRYLPDLPETWKDITVRRLLTHTSGIKGYTEVWLSAHPAGDALSLVRNPHTPQEILSLVANQPLDFPPGKKWEYSNTGYFMLGMLIEKVSGKSYAEFLSERIFKPLGMTSTRNSDPAAVIPNRAGGYLWTGKWENAPALQPSSAFSAGCLVSTINDLAKWDAALYSDKLLKMSSRNEMWTPTKLTGGEKTPYGLGWFIGASGGHKVIEHSGNTVGFSTMISRYVNDRLTVIVLTNRGDANVRSIQRGIAAFFPALAKPVEKAASATATAARSHAAGLGLRSILQRMPGGS